MKKSFSGVYALFCGNEIVYVGESADVYRRISEHTFGKGRVLQKDFDTWEFIEVENVRERRYIESALIRFFNPYYNKQLNQVCSLDFDQVKALRKLCKNIYWLFDAVKHVEQDGRRNDWRIINDFAL